MKTPKDTAINLVDTFRIILMNEDTDCGYEALCTLIAIKMARVTLNEQIKELVNYSTDRVNFLKQAIKELEKI